MKKVVILFAALLLIASSVIAVGIFAAQKLAAPAPTNNNSSRNLQADFEECMRVTGAIEDTSFAPMDTCVMNGKTYYSSDALNGVTQGSTDLASCLKKVNNSEANEEILEQARQACYDRYR